MQGYILYDYNSQQSLVPQIATLAGVRNSLPIDVGTQEELLATAQAAGAVEVLDLTEEWAGYDAGGLGATRYIFENHVNETTALSKQNPGWSYPNSDRFPNLPFDVPDINGVLTGSPNVGLVDFIVQQKLFNMCVARWRHHPPPAHPLTHPPIHPSTHPPPSSGTCPKTAFGPLPRTT